MLGEMMKFDWHIFQLSENSYRRVVLLKKNEGGISFVAKGSADQHSPHQPSALPVFRSGQEMCGGSSACCGFSRDHDLLQALYVLHG